MPGRFLFDRDQFPQYDIPRVVNIRKTIEKNNLIAFGIFQFRFQVRHLAFFQSSASQYQHPVELIP